MQMAVVGDPRAGDAPDVPAEVESFGPVDGAQRLEPLRAEPVDIDDLCLVETVEVPPCRYGATSRWPDAYGNLFSSTNASSPRWTTRCSTSSPSAARQKMQPSCSSAAWTYSSRHGAHRRSTRRAYALPVSVTTSREIESAEVTRTVAAATNAKTGPFAYSPISSRFDESFQTK